MGARRDVIGESAATRDRPEELNGRTPHLHDRALPRLAPAKTPRPKVPRGLAGS